MSGTTICPTCGANIPAGAPGGQCPKCLINAGFESEDISPTGPEPLTPGSQPAGFEPPAVAQLRQLFPQLEILELAGRGGMGAVYKARQPVLDRLVAVKILPAEASRGPMFAERFTREARAMARLNHPNIVAIHDFGQTEGLFYFVMEYVDGVNLRQMIQSGTIQPEQALAIVPQICDALQFAHDEGIVHRDIKPENVLIDTKGQVKIADFGLARLLGQEQDATLTHPDQVMGTLRYMAPEQMQGTHNVDHRADIFSLGVVFYELLTGMVPMWNFDPPSKKVQIDVRLDQVVLRALAQQPERRYQQASDVKTDVETLDSTPADVVTKAWGGPDPQSPSKDGGLATDIDAARRRVGGPALGLSILGLLTMFTHTVFFVYGALNDPLPWDWPYVLALLGIPLGLCMTLGGIAMRTFASRGCAVAGAIAAAIPVGPGTVLGIPLGISALLVLRPDRAGWAFDQLREDDNSDRLAAVREKQQFAEKQTSWRKRPSFRVGLVFLLLAAANPLLGMLLFQNTKSVVLNMANDADLAESMRRDIKGNGFVDAALANGVVVAFAGGLLLTVGWRGAAFLPLLPLSIAWPANTLWAMWGIHFLWRSTPVSRRNLEYVLLGIGSAFLAWMGAGCLFLYHWHIGEMTRQLAIVAQEGNQRRVIELVGGGADVHAQDEFGNEAINAAATGGDSATITQLVTFGANVNARNVRGETPLMEVSSRGQRRAIQTLLSAGADVNARDNEGHTPLMRAAYNGHVEATETLLHNEADIRDKDIAGKTALDLAVYRDQPDVVDVLVKNDAELTSSFFLWRGYSAAKRGEFTTAVAHLKQAVALTNPAQGSQTAFQFGHERFSTMQPHALAVVMLASAHICAGELDEAKAQFEQLQPRFKSALPLLTVISLSRRAEATVEFDADNFRITHFSLPADELADAILEPRLLTLTFRSDWKKTTTVGTRRKRSTKITGQTGSLTLFFLK